jgi:GNAT superfamily N-acetyltransferase
VDPAIHPEHKGIAQTVKGWFHLPFRGMGYLAERRRWGTYWSNAQVYTSGFPVAELEPFMADLRRYYADQPEAIHVYIDDPAADAELGPLMLEAGWEAEVTELFLAHVGPVAQPLEMAGLEIWPVFDTNLGQFVATQLRAYGNTEDMPDPSRVRAEIARRQREMSGTEGGLLARVHGQPAGIIWWHEEPLEIWINQVGVRVPFRHQGIAGELLRQCTESAYARGLKSVLLNVASDNREAIRLYQRMGFRDEVYCHRCYIGRLWEK